MNFSEELAGKRSLKYCILGVTQKYFQNIFKFDIENFKKQQRYENTLYKYPFYVNM